VPFLIIGASVLLALQERIRARVLRRLAARERAGPHEAWVAVPAFAASVYGGYFGAGLGVILMAVLGLVLEDSLTRLNALKQALSFCVNVTAAAYFLFSGEVVWSAALVMAVAALVGVPSGAVRREDAPDLLRRIVVAIGLVVGVAYLVKEWRYVTTPGRRTRSTATSPEVRENARGCRTGVTRSGGGRGDPAHGHVPGTSVHSPPSRRDGLGGVSAFAAWTCRMPSSSSTASDQPPAGAVSVLELERSATGQAVTAGCRFRGCVVRHVVTSGRKMVRPGVGDRRAAGPHVDTPRKCPWDARANLRGSHRGAGAGVGSARARHRRP
jgi:hypothetical protein